MQVLPVLDLLNGVVVRGIAGNRSEYRPVISQLTQATDALSVAHAFRDQLGLSEFYVADLDAILHQQPNWSIYEQLAAAGFACWIDSGLREVAEAQKLVAAGARKVIAGLETWPGPAELATLCTTIGPAQVVFSLDLQGGLAMRPARAWGTAEPIDIGLQAIAAGICQMIVLDVAQVGVGAGVTTLGLCRQFQARHPGLRLVTGGGIRHFDDLADLDQAGIAGVLVASALHDGRIGLSEIARLAGASYSNPC
ncbi:MAG: hisA/hisF family protein [Planctomycetes bacterium]|nr:hisA/hisF family protein [Planctomycetota bacterium]